MIFSGHWLKELGLCSAVEDVPYYSCFEGCGSVGAEAEGPGRGQVGGAPNLYEGRGSDGAGESLR